MSTYADLSRQSFLGADADRVLRSARVAIVGLGGGGSHVAQQLAHVGVGGFRLIDPGTIDASNLNRLVTADQQDVDGELPKVQILRRTILGVRPWADVRVEQTSWQEVPSLIADAHVLVGSVDGYRQREYLERAARRFGVPYIDIGMDVTATTGGQFAIAGQAIMTRPGCPCMKCLGFLTPDRLNREEDNYGHAGAVPQVVWTNGILASLAVGMLVKLLTPWYNGDRSFEWLELDGNAQTVEPSIQPEFALRGPCHHFDGPDDLGDPFFSVDATAAKNRDR